MAIMISKVNDGHCDHGAKYMLVKFTQSHSPSPSGYGGGRHWLSWFWRSSFDTIPFFRDYDFVCVGDHYDGHDDDHADFDPAH